MSACRLEVMVAKQKSNIYAMGGTLPRAQKLLKKAEWSLNKAAKPAWPPGKKCLPAGIVFWERGEKNLFKQFKVHIRPRAGKCRASRLQMSGASGWRARRSALPFFA
jgi:hypothetical protein